MAKLAVLAWIALAGLAGAQPNLPTGVAVNPVDDGSLAVSWTPNDATTTAYDVKATAQFAYPQTINVNYIDNDAFAGTTINTTRWTLFEGPCTYWGSSYSCFSSTDTVTQANGQLVYNVRGMSTWYNGYAAPTTATTASDWGWNGIPILARNRTAPGEFTNTAAGNTYIGVRVEAINASASMTSGYYYGDVGMVLYDLPYGGKPRWVWRYYVLSYNFAYSTGPQNTIYMYYSYLSGTYMYGSGYYLTGYTGKYPVDLWLIRNPTSAYWQVQYQALGLHGSPMLYSTFFYDTWTTAPTVQPKIAANLRVGLYGAEGTSYNYGIMGSFSNFQMLSPTEYAKYVAWASYWSNYNLNKAAYGICAVARDITRRIAAPATSYTLTGLTAGTNYSIAVTPVNATGVGGNASAPGFYVAKLSLPVPGVKLFLDAASMPAPVNSATGPAVRTWPDQSGFGNHMTVAAESTVSPTLQGSRAGKPYNTVNFDGNSWLVMAAGGNDTDFGMDTAFSNHDTTIFTLYTVDPTYPSWYHGPLLTKGHSEYTGESGWQILAYSYSYSSVTSSYIYSMGAAFGPGFYSAYTVLGQQPGTTGWPTTGPIPGGNQPTLITYAYRRNASITTTRQYDLDACMGFNRGTSSDMCTFPAQGVTSTRNPWTSSQIFFQGYLYNSRRSAQMSSITASISPLALGAAYYTYQYGSTVYSYYNYYRFRGTVSAIAIYKKALNQTDMYNVQRYLADRYNMRCPPQPTNTFTGMTTPCDEGSLGDTCAQACDVAGAATNGTVKYSRFGGLTSLTCYNGRWVGKATWCSPTCPTVSAPADAASCVKYVLLDGFNGTDGTVFSSLNKYDVAPGIPARNADKYWSLQRGQLQLSMPTPVDSCDFVDTSSMLFQSAPVWNENLQLTEPATTEARVTITTTGTRAGITFRVIDAAAGNYYRFLVTADSNRMSLEKVAAFTGVQSAAWRNLTTMYFPRNQAHHLKVRVQAVSATNLAAVILAYVNDTMVFNVTDSSSAWPSGPSGVYGETGVSLFDNLAVSVNCDNGGGSCQKLGDGQDCRFTCAPGFYMLGDSTQACGSAGKILNTPASCVPLPPVFTGGRFNVSEDAAATTLLGTLNSTAANPSQIVLYTINPATNWEVMYDRFGNSKGNVSDLFSVNMCSGEVKLDKAGVLSYNTGTRSFYLSVSACANGNNASCTVASVRIDVTKVPNPPYFEADPVTGATGQWLRYVKENAAVGTAIAPVITAYNPNGNANRYSISFGNADGLFALDPATGNLTVARAALDFEAVPQYNLLITAADAVNANLTGVVYVTVQLNNTNDVPTATSPQVLSITEAFPSSLSAGTIVGHVAVADQDAGDALTYTMDATSAPLMVVTTEGMVKTTAPLQYDPQTAPIFVVDGFQCRDAWKVNVTATDRAGAFVRVQLNVYVLANVSVAEDPVIDGVTLPPTGLGVAGGDTFTVTGRHFNTISTVTGSETNMTLQLTNQASDPFNRTYTVTSCRVATADTLQCTAPAGFGSALALRGWWGSPWKTMATTTAVLVSYRAPVVTGVASYSAVTPVVSPSALSTAGSDRFIVMGTDLYVPGAPPAALTVQWGNSTLSLGTPVVEGSYPSPTAVLVSTSEGYGARLPVTLTLGGLTSAVNWNATVSYAAPRLTRVSVPVGATYALGNMSTAGGQDYVLEGSNFGPASYIPTVQYGTLASRLMDIEGVASNVTLMYAAANCRKDALAPHTRLVCSSAPGVGASLSHRITVGNLAPVTGGAASGNVTYFTYGAPVVTEVTGAGLNGGDTEGGQDVLITGSNLGPQAMGDASFPGARTSVPFSVTYGATGTEYVLRSCVVTRDVPNTVRCQTAPGIGKNLRLRPTVAGVTGGLYAGSLAYGAPVVTAYDRNETDALGRKLPLSAYLTQGMETVRIMGKNFGPALVASQFAAEYTTLLHPPSTSFNSSLGDAAGTLHFAVNASQCEMEVPHRQILCYTVPGAGAALRWNVQVGNQSSTTPTTGYARPVIYNVTLTDGTRPVVANTDGGLQVRLVGRNFGAAIADCSGSSACNYVQYVKYGLSGSTYLATVESVSDTVLQVSLAPGFGGSASAADGLYFTVKVADQVSDLSAQSVKYMPPAVVSVSPATAALDPTGAAQTIITVTGTNFGLRDPQAAVGVLFGNPADFTLSTLLQPFATSVTGGTQTLRFYAPPGVGRNRAVRVVTYFASEVGSTPTYQVLSDPAADGGSAYFSYADPSITNVVVQSVQAYAGGALSANSTLGRFITAEFGSDADDGTYSRLRVLTVNGANFGPAASVTRDSVGRSVEAVGLSVDTSNSTDAPWSSEGFAVYAWDYTRIVVITDVTEGQLRVRLDTAAYDGTRTQVVTSASAYSEMSPAVGGLVSGMAGPFRTEGSAVLGFTVMNLMSLSQSLSVTVGGRACPLVSRLGALLDVSTPTAVMALRDNCDYYSTPSAGCGTVTLATVWTLYCRVPEGDGAQLSIVVARDGMPSNTDQTVSYQPPSITAYEVTIGSQTTWYNYTTPRTENEVNVPTDGARVRIYGANFGTCPAVSMYTSVDIGLGGDRPGCPAHAANQTGSVANHTVLEFTTVPGEGRGFPLSISAGGQTTASEGGTPLRLNYLPPTVATVTSAGSTQGGDVVTVTGSNFGVSTPNVTLGSVPCLDVQRASSTLLTCVLPEGSGAALRVTVTAGGQASSQPVTFSYAAPAVAAMHVAGPHGSYNVTGGALAGYGNTTALETVTLVGANFGAYRSDAHCLFLAWPGRKSSAFSCNGRVSFLGEGELPFSVAAGASGGPDGTANATDAVPIISVWNHTHIVFRVPPGVGARHIVPFVNGQLPASLPVWRYAAPVVTGMTPVSGGTLGGDAITLHGYNFGWQANASMSASDFADVAGVAATWDAFTTASRHPQAMLVVNFFRTCVTPYVNAEGARPTDAVRCVSAGLLAYSDTAVTLLTQAGIGRGKAVTVQVVELAADWKTAAALGSSASNTMLFDYDAPHVTSTSPRVLLQDGQTGLTITLNGLNFGKQPDDSTVSEASRWTGEERVVNVSIAGVPCLSTTRVRRGGVNDTSLEDSLQCATPQLPVGYQALNYTVAGQVGYTGVNESGAVFTACAAGYYGYPGETCLPCPRQDVSPPGATCRGFDPNAIVAATAVGYSDRGTHTYPRPRPGWYNLNDTARAACPPEVLPLFAGRDLCIVPCQNADACLADNVCAEGYVSKAPVFRCASCAAGFYKRATSCVRCPSSPYAIVVVVVLLVIAAAAGAYILNKKKINVAYISIGIDYAQVLAIFANSDVPWPGPIQELFQVLSAFNLNIEIVAPECLVPDVSFKQKWAFVVALPVGVVVFFSLVTACSVAYKLLLKGRKVKMSNEGAAFASSCILLMYVLYIYLTRTVLEVYNCTPNDPTGQDTTQYMGSTGEPCGEAGGTQMTLLPWAIIATIVYIAGYPAGIGYVLWRNRELIMEDQLLRAKGAGGDKLSNPHAYPIRKRWSRIYYQFKPDYFLWLEVITLRKFLIAATYVLFNRNAAFQLAACLLILFVAYAAQVRFSPYMGPAEYAAVLKDHVQASYTSAIHAQLRATIAAVEGRGRRRGHRNLLNREGKVDPRAALGMLTSWLFNYNTVESYMLFSASIVCLMGIMFTAQATASTYYASSRDAITGVLLAVAVVSIVYIVGVIVAEIFILYTEEQRTKAAQAAAGKGKGKDLSDLPDKRDRDEEFEVGNVSQAMNPMFLSASTSGGGGGGGGGGSMDPASVDVLAAGEAIRSMATPPPVAEIWRVYRDTYAQLLQRVQDLKRQLDGFSPEVRTMMQAGRNPDGASGDPVATAPAPTPTAAGYADDSERSSGGRKVASFKATPVAEGKHGADGSVVSANPLASARSSSRRTNF